MKMAEVTYHGEGLSRTTPDGTKFIRFRKVLVKASVAQRLEGRLDWSVVYFEPRKPAVTPNASPPALDEPAASGGEEPSEPKVLRQKVR